MATVWWEQHEEYYLQAMSYLTPLMQRRTHYSHLKKFFSEYEKTILTQFIFESNTIEHEGLSASETKKIVFSRLPDIEEIRRQIKDRLHLDTANIDIDLSFKESDDPELQLIYKNKKKQMCEVTNHVIAILESENIALGYALSMVTLHNKLCKKCNYYKRKYKSDPDNVKKFEELFKRHIKLYEHDTYNQHIITSETLKLIHKRLSTGLDNNNNGLPGEYRVDGAYINENTIFLEPGLISQAVKKVTAEHHERLHSSDMNPLLEACKISADVVKIHPFGDFNGRTSRIVLNTVLLAHNFPFHVVLRGNGHNRKKYITAMKHYFSQGRISSYVALVSMCLLNQVADINARLSLAGIEPIQPVDITEHKSKYLDQLKHYIEISKTNCSVGY